MTLSSTANLSVVQMWTRRKLLFGKPLNLDWGWISLEHFQHVCFDDNLLSVEGKNIQRRKYSFSALGFSNMSCRVLFCVAWFKMLGEFFFSEGYRVVIYILNRGIKFQCWLYTLNYLCRLSNIYIHVCCILKSVCKLLNIRQFHEIIMRLSGMMRSSDAGYNTFEGQPSGTKVYRGP